ncbi:hypothetical protein NP569_25780, partial [Vibrio parahaemolyticus]|nr:hypothetical protein [Vibrio parahaemolyticus]
RLFSRISTKREVCLELAAIVNDVKKGTIGFPFALVPEAVLVHIVGCDAGASYQANVNSPST